MACYAQGQEDACIGKEYKYFDFWIGDWTINSRSRPPGSDTWSSNKTWIMTRVYSDLAGCAIVEESIDKVGSDTVIVGKSLTSFNKYLGKFQQMWVDTSGNSWEFIGGMEGDNMILYLEPISASGESLVSYNKETQLRMIFKEITKNRFIWEYEYSTDGSKTWISTMEAIYTRLERKVLGK